MRAWGLAQGLKSHGIEVTIAVNVSFPQEIDNHKGVKLVNWAIDEHFKDLINSYDSVIAPYTMGSNSEYIASNIHPNVQLILDAYVPIYVEVSAREADDMDSEYAHYMDDSRRYNHVLKRGDYFLAASQTQKLYYTGVLSALGIINPRSYRQNRLLTVPFGIHDEPATAKNDPYEKLGIKKDDFVVLWFGGLYPWFRIDELLDAIKELSKDQKIKFAIVGGKNPFNPNPDLARQYNAALEFAKEHNLLDRSLFFVDWVDFKDRINWYKRANVVISINQPGEENVFSWRTRVMDYVWGELPILTNGGDPLSEELIGAAAARRLESLSEAELVSSIKDLARNPEQLAKLKENVIKIKADYHWPKLVEPIVKAIEAGEKPYADEKAYKKHLGLSAEATALPNLAASSAGLGKVRRSVALSKRALSYARRKGLKRSARLALTIAGTQAKKKAGMSKSKRYIFISNPIENTGAPIVLLQIVEEFAAKYGTKNIQLITNHILPHHLRRLREKGIKVDKAAMGLGNKLLELQFGLKKDEFVLMNTLAIYSNYRDYVLNALKTGKLAKAYWFIHEDTGQLPYVAPELRSKKESGWITRLANKGKLRLIVPSKKVQADYEEIWQTKEIKVVPLKVDVPEKYKRRRPEKEYEKVDFLLSGQASDGRKGQLIAISAFYSFMKNYYEKAPANYRDFTLNLINIGDDYISQHVKIIGGSLLGDKLQIFPSLPLDESLRITAKCNAVICCSFNETFALYVAEGMFMGHAVLRNDSAGMDEQLKEAKNGYFIDSTDIDQFAGVIEKVLNKKTNTNKSLQKMGRESQAMIAPFAKNTYRQKIELL